MTAPTGLLPLVNEFAAIDGVRGALVAGAEGAMDRGEGSGLTAKVADDIARTARRMTVASSTVGVPLEELTISFGSARVVIMPLPSDAILVVLVDSDAALPEVRALAEDRLPALGGLAEATPAPPAEDEAPAAPAAEQHPGDEVEHLMAGELGPILNYIDARFVSYMERAEILDRDEAHAIMRAQMREWLLCCNPSPYTFPLLLDALAQQLNDAPEIRGEFMIEVQEALQYSDIWSGKAERG